MPIAAGRNASGDHCLWRCNEAAVGRRCSGSHMSKAAREAGGIHADDKCCRPRALPSGHTLPLRAPVTSTAARSVQAQLRRCRLPLAYRTAIREDGSTPPVRHNGPRQTVSHRLPFTHDWPHPRARRMSDPVTKSTSTRWHKLGRRLDGELVNACLRKWPSAPAKLTLKHRGTYAVVRSQE